MTVEIRLCETIGVPPDAVWAAMEDIETHTEWMADAVAITFRTDAAHRASAPSSSASPRSARSRRPT